MKYNRKLIVIIVFVVALILASVILALVMKTKMDQKAKEELNSNYCAMWNAIPHSNEFEDGQYSFGTYENVEKKALIYRIGVYNYVLHKNLKPNDFEDFLSNEYNEDGTYKIHVGYDEIYAFIEWWNDPSNYHFRKESLYIFRIEKFYCEGIYPILHNEEQGQDNVFYEVTAKQLWEIESAYNDANTGIDLSEWGVDNNSEKAKKVRDLMTNWKRETVDLEPDYEVFDPELMEGFFNIIKDLEKDKNKPFAVLEYSYALFIDIYIDKEFILNEERWDACKDTFIEAAISTKKLQFALDAFCYYTEAENAITVDELVSNYYDRDVDSEVSYFEEYVNWYNTEGGEGIIVREYPDIFAETVNSSAFPQEYNKGKSYLFYTPEQIHEIYLFMKDFQYEFSDEVWKD